MAVARFVNHTDTLDDLGFPAVWDAKRFIKVLEFRKKRGEQVFTGAYLITSNGHKGSKIEHIANRVLTPLWEDRNKLRPFFGEELQHYAEKLQPYQGLGGFMIGQIIADLKYAQLHTAPDWDTWAISGPGSRRGMNRVIGKPLNFHMKEDEWHARLIDLRRAVNKTIGGHMRGVHAQDLQNCLCEFDKYERVRLGEGRPRSLYPGLPGE